MNKTKYNWDNVDWSKSNKTLAKELKLTERTISLRRQQYHPSPRPIIDWSKADWTKSNKEIAQTLDTSTSYVADKRRALGKIDDAPPKWWQVCDWKKSNKTLAKETGLSEHTIAKRRVNLGLSHTGAKETRKDKGISTPQPHLAKPEYQRLGTQTAKQSPKSGRFETNINAKIWTVKDPNNKTHTFTNLLHFVRQNPHLFDPADTVWRKKKSGAEWCRASSGIGGLASKSNQAHQWKGWKLISVTNNPQSETNND